MKVYPIYHVKVNKTVTLGNNAGQRMTLNPGDIGTMQAVADPSPTTNHNSNPILIESIFPGKKISNSSATNGLMRSQTKGDVLNNDIRPLITKDNTVTIMPESAGMNMMNAKLSNMSGDDSDMISGSSLLKLGLVGVTGSLLALLANSTMEKPMLSKDGQKVALGIAIISGLVVAYEYMGGGSKDQRTQTGTEISNLIK